MLSFFKENKVGFRENLEGTLNHYFGLQLHVLRNDKRLGEIYILASYTFYFLAFNSRVFSSLGVT